VSRRPPIDHLVWGGSDLEWEIDRIERLTGVRAVPGGRHPGEGTRNALIPLGAAMYLELIGPDPSQEPVPQPRWFDLDTLLSPRLITWAVKTTDLDHRAAAARNAGVLLGEVRSGRRELSGGQVLTWRLTYPDVRAGDGLVPFLIDWGEGSHPSEAAASGARLVDLRAEHPTPAVIIEQLNYLDLDLDVLPGPRPALVATLDTPRGLVELR
jgi:glyoxalase-like protein